MPVACRVAIALPVTIIITNCTVCVYIMYLARRLGQAELLTPTQMLGPDSSRRDLKMASTYYLAVDSYKKCK